MKTIQKTKIEGYPNYTIDENGNIYSLSHDKFMTPQRHPNGYRTVQLRHNGKSKTFMIHTLVLRAFIHNGNPSAEVDHIDNDRSNNKLSNLRWVSRKKNANNLVGKRFVFKNPFKAIKDGIELKFEKQIEAARYLNVHPTSIHQVLNGVLKSVKGYSFQYIF